MSAFLLVLLVCLSLSMHACSARHLRTKAPTIVATHLELGVAEKKTSDSPILSRPSSSLFVSKDLRALPEDDQQVRNKGVEGIVRSMEEITVFRSENHLQRQAEATKVEKIQEKSIRFMSETSEAKHDGAKETMGSKDHSGDIVEDIVVMDYAQPHRKPPIHNEKN